MCVSVIPGQKWTTLPSCPPLRCLATWLPDPALVQAAHELWLRWPAYFSYVPRFCCHTAATLQALRWQRYWTGAERSGGGSGGEDGQTCPHCNVALQWNWIFIFICMHVFITIPMKNVRFVAAHESVQRATFLPKLLLCVNILISQLVKCQFSIWIFIKFTSQIYSHQFDNVLQTRIAWIVPQLVGIKSQIWSMLSMWPALARRRNWSHVPGECNTDTHTHTYAHTVNTPTQCILYACLQIAHTPCITQDQAANQQRVGRLQFAVIMAPNSTQIMLE